MENKILAIIWAIVGTLAYYNYNSDTKLLGIYFVVLSAILVTKD